MRPLILALVACACSTEIVSGLDERDSREALALLARQGVASDRKAVQAKSGESQLYALTVQSGEAGRAAAILEASGIPRVAEAGFRELYSQPSIIPSVTEERARFTAAVSGEIARHLEELPGVVDASVLVAMPENDPLAPPDQVRLRPTASVLLRVTTAKESPQLADVQKLVAGAVVGMTSTDVTVVSAQAPTIAATPLLAKVGPIRVVRSSLRGLLTVLAGGCAIVIAMALWILRSERFRAKSSR